MSKRAKQAALKAYPYSPSEVVAYDRSETIEIDGNLYGRAKYIEGYEQAEKDMTERIVIWLRKNWRNYVWTTDNGIPHFGHFEKELRKAMEE